VDKTISSRSFLIIGDSKQAETEVEKIAKSFGINISLASPDKSRIAPEKKHLTIDQVRNIKKTIHQKPVKDKFKIIIIEEAHTLTPEGQNALLKTLEEPPQHAVVILQANNKASLLPTILSRVVTINKTPKKPEATTNILLQDIGTALVEIAKIKNAEEFLDSQIILLSESLLKRVNPNKSKVIETIEKCVLAKQMINSNVDSHHVLTNLILSLNLGSA